MVKKVSDFFARLSEQADVTFSEEFSSEIDLYSKVEPLIEAYSNSSISHAVKEVDVKVKSENAFDLEVFLNDNTSIDFMHNGCKEEFLTPIAEVLGLPYEDLSLTRFEVISRPTGPSFYFRVII